MDVDDLRGDATHKILQKVLYFPELNTVVGFHKFQNGCMGSLIPV